MDKKIFQSIKTTNTLYGYTNLLSTIRTALGNNFKENLLPIVQRAASIYKNNSINFQEANNKMLKPGDRTNHLIKLLQLLSRKITTLINTQEDQFVDLLSSLSMKTKKEEYFESFQEIWDFTNFELLSDGFSCSEITVSI